MASLTLQDEPVPVGGEDALDRGLGLQQLAVQLFPARVVCSGQTYKTLPWTLMMRMQGHHALSIEQTCGLKEGTGAD